VSNAKDMIRNTNVEATKIKSSNVATDERRKKGIIKKNSRRRSIMIGLVIYD